MAKRSLLCRYCKGPEQFQAEYPGNRLGTRWGVRCLLSSGPPIRCFYTSEQAQRSIDEWCFGDGRRVCRLYLLKETKHNYNFAGDLLQEFDAMEEKTVAKQTYYCVCGKTFKKSSTAQSTGYRLDGYDKVHECYGCPFVEQVMEGYPVRRIKAYECRASADRVRYETIASMRLDSDQTAHVFTLDLAWLDFFINFYLDTPGCGRSITRRDPAALEKAFRNAYLHYGRRAYSFEFEKNKRGREARRIVQDKFFDEKGEAYQLGCGESNPKVRILQMIEYAKQKAKEDNDMAKLEVPVPDASTCPYYNGIETIYSPKGYYINCTQRYGCDRTLYELKSWALDAVKDRCLSKEAYGKCIFYKRAQQDKPLPAPPRQLAETVSTTHRDITAITAEIHFYKAQTVQNIIEIGKRLIEAKAMLEYGQWGEWLENAIEFSQSTANRFMQIAADFADSAPVRNLSYTKLLALLTIPADEREDFIETTHIVDGQEKTVDKMSKRELQRVIKERDEAKQQAKEAQRIADLNEQTAVQRQQELETLRAKQRRLKDENQRQRLDIERLENRPIDVAVQAPSAQEMDALRNNIRHEVMQELALPDQYFAKKGIDEASSLFMDAISGAVANGFIFLMRMDGKAAANTLRLYISTLENHRSDLEKRLNIMMQVDRTSKEGMDDVEW